MPLAPFCFSSKRALFFCWAPVSVVVDPEVCGNSSDIDSLLWFPMMEHGLRQWAEGADFSARSMAAKMFANAVFSGRPASPAARRGIEGLPVRRVPRSEAA
jgi:hypothetical protein